jgi:hypothetical protein
MNWDAIGAIYLAWQVRQNTAQVRLSRVQETSSSLQDGFAVLYHPGNPQIWYKGHYSPDELDEQDTHTFRLFMERALYNVQNVVYQHEHGLIDQDVYESTIQQMRELLIDTPGGSTFWQGRRHIYTTSMRAALEEKNHIG